MAAKRLSGFYDPPEKVAAPSPPELAGFRDLLEQLVSEFTRVEAWAHSVCDNNSRLRASATGVPTHCNGDAVPEGIVELQAEQFTELQHVERVEYRQKRESEHSVSFEPEIDTHRKENVETEFDRYNLIEVQGSTQAAKSDISSSSSQPKSPNGGDYLQIDRTNDEFDEEFGEQDEVVCISELKMWFEKLLRKESKRYEMRALSPKYIQNLFIETDADFTRDEVSIAEAVNGITAAARIVMRKPGFFTKQITTFSSSLLAFEDKGNIPDGMMDFDTFVELMIWNRVEAIINTKVKNHALEIREVLIKQSVDELIFEFSGLSPAKKTKPPPLHLRIIEPVVGVVVLLNALTIGISADTPWAGWESLEYVYTSFFICEIVLKVSVYGLKHHFLGEEMAWNIFDLAIVSLAVFDLAVSLLVSSDTALSNLTVMRLARLAKITRLLRLIRIVRLRCFKELLLLVKGVVAGMRTLAWAFVLLATLVYIIGIMMRQTVGERSVTMDDKYRTVLFHSVPWSMFQTFRCFTDDCTLADGTPLLAHLYEMYGWMFTIPWALAELFVEFGVFNLIMAVFVENVQENAKMKRQLTRDDERARVVSRMRELVMLFGGKSENDEENYEVRERRRHSEKLNTGLAFLTNTARDVPEATPTKVHFQFGGIITRDMFNKVISQPGVHDILDDLEVHVSDRSELFDLLDADRSNSVDVSELIHGILKLRSGGADKSDIVATILGIRSLQKQIATFMESAFEHQAMIRNDLKEQIDQLQLTRREMRSGGFPGHHPCEPIADDKSKVSL